jgi:VanZ family protein
MRRVLAVVCGLLIYGSLYPWKFAAGPAWLDAIRHVPRAWPERLHGSDLRDIVLNVALYLAVGFCGYLSWGGRSRLWRAVGPCALGMGLSWLVEAAQHYVPGRNPSAVDLLTNTLGSCGGVVLGWGYEKTVQARLRQLAWRSSTRLSSALLLLLIWLGATGFPLRLNDNALIGKLKYMLRGGWSWTEFCGELLCVLVVGVLLGEMIELRVARAGLAGVWLVAVGLRMLSPGHTLGGAEVVGGALAVALFVWSPVRRPVLTPLLAVGWLVWLAVDGLRPWRWVEAAEPFGWMPFLDMLASTWLATLAVLLRKLWMYGAGFWLLERSGVGRATALAGLSALVLGVEVAQRHLPGRYGGLTDPALAALACLLVWAVEQRYARRYR